MKKYYMLAFALILGNAIHLQATNPYASRSGAAQNNTNAAELRINTPSHVTNHVMRRPSQAQNTVNAGCAFVDHFDGANDTTSLQARGYLTYYRSPSAPGTAPTWFQGIPLIIPSYDGPNDGYVASNFQTVTGTNDINNWLVLPALNLNAGDIFSFYSSSPIPFDTTVFVDSLHIWYSAVGDSTPEDTTWVLLGEFQVNVAGFWELNSFVIPSAGATGRLAIQYAVVDGGPTGDNSNYVGIDALTVFTPSPADAIISGITNPITNCDLSSSETISVDIQNIGTDSIFGFDISYTLDSGAAVVESMTDSIPPGGFITYNFIATADLSAVGAHTLEVSVTGTNDVNNCNDNLFVTVFNFGSPAPDPFTTAFTMGFEASEDFSNWRIQDQNGDLATWDIADTLAHSGLMCMRKVGSGEDDDDWLITSCIDMVDGQTYTLDYWYKNFELANPCSLEVYIGEEQESTAMSQILVQNTIPTDTMYNRAIVSFSVPTAGTWYVGFHAYSFQGTGTSSLRIDDINIDDGSSVGVKELVSHSVSLYPNPNSGRFTLSSRSYVRKASVQVFNTAGQEVFAGAFSQISNQTIDLGDQANGVYYVRITSDSFVENHRIVVNK